MNVMLPRKYSPSLQGNVYERVTRSIVRQLIPDVTMELDYDQLLNKRPNEPEAKFLMHQDMAYWPPPSFYPDTRTATFSLALDETTKENGAIQFVTGSHKPGIVRKHVPAGENRQDNHAIRVDIGAEETIEWALVPRGGLSVHNELIVHGSAGNTTPGNRRTYVVAYRTAEMVRRESGRLHPLARRRHQLGHFQQLVTSAAMWCGGLVLVPVTSCNAEAEVDAKDNDASLPT